MTRSEEESSVLSLLSQLQSPSCAEIYGALQTAKHRLIGHDQTKELYVRLGIAKELASILSGSARTEDWLRVKVEAGIVVGSLAYGGESYILHLLSCDILRPLIDSLDPETSPKKLIHCSLRTLNTMVDAYVSPSALLDSAAAIASALYTPAGLNNLHKILCQSSSERLIQDQISLAASLIAKSCGRTQPTDGEGGEGPRRGRSHQTLLVEAGVLGALATRLGSHAPDEYRRKAEDKLRIPPRAPSTARLAPLLDAISTIIKESKLRSIEFLFSPTLVALFPHSSSGGNKSSISRLTEGTPAAGATSVHLPQSKPSSNLIEPPQQIITPAAFPPLSAAVSSSSSSQYHSSSNHSPSFPPLHHYAPPHHTHSHRHHHGLTEAQQLLLGVAPGVAPENDSDSGGDTPSNRMTEADLDDDERLRSAANAQPAVVEPSEPALDIEESELTNWLISLVRSGDAVTRLAAANVLANLFYVGLVSKRLVPCIALLVVPVLVRLMDEDIKIEASSGTGIGGIDAHTWYRWQIEEQAPAVLSSLVDERVENQKAAVEYRKAAVDAGAIKKLAALLKMASELPSSAVNGVNGDAAHTPGDEPPAKTDPEYSHRVKVKVGALNGLANLGLYKDEYRKTIIECGVVQTIVSSCLKPLTPILSPLPPENTNAEGNPPNVLIAACGVIRSVSRSVSILRTSLIDAGVAIPMFSLLRHENIGVRIAAAAGVCNLVLEFSPMRKPILDAGAVEVLCDMVKGPNGQLRFNALWAIKHLVLDADSGVKRRSFENLGAEHIMSIISTVNTDPSTDPVAADSDGDEEMADEPQDHPGSSTMEDSIRILWPGGDSTPSKVEQRLPHLPLKARTVVNRLQRKARTLAATQSRKEAIALQEQAIDFLRNLVCGTEASSMIDLVLGSLGADRLLSLLETILTAPNQPGEIVNAVVYVVVHIAAGAPRHRQRIIERTNLLRSLLDLWNHRISSVRSGLAWIVINLTWAEDGDEAEGVQGRINVLRNLGWADKLKEMRKDSELDVKERVKTAEYQLGAGERGSGSTGNGGR